MIRRLFRLIILAAAAAGVAAVVRALTTKDDPLPAPAAAPSREPWPPLRNETAPPKPASSVTVEPEPAGVPVANWIEPEADGACPASHPIKANMKSKIFHSPGQLNYDRTTPDRCYVDAASAEADGLRAAKR